MNVFNELSIKNDLLTKKLPITVSLNTSCSQQTSLLEKGIDVLDLSPSLSDLEEIEDCVNKSKVII